MSNSAGKVLATDGAALQAPLAAAIQSALDNQSYDNAQPKAYLNWVLVDNQFGYVSEGTGAQQVPAIAAGDEGRKVLSPAEQTMPQSGYLYVYLSNESPQDVYFDDLTVKHYTGPLLQEQDYYPFGLQMAGISDKALNKHPSYSE